MSTERDQRIATATEDLDVAQREVERAMKELATGNLRANKTITSEALSTVFEKLALARQKLASVISEGTGPT